MFPDISVLGNKTYPASVQGFIVSADAIEANQILFGANPNPNKRAFCQSCDFIKWGAWGARVEQTAKTATAMCRWAGGSLASRLLHQHAERTKATYDGRAVGNVVNN